MYKTFCKFIIGQRVKTFKDMKKIRDESCIV